MSAPAGEVDVVVVGAGFAGMYAIIRLRELGFSLRCFETADEVGGTWYWNRYPGCRVDVESLAYSYWFDDALQAEWHWEREFATQPEVLAYARHVADRYDLRPAIAFGTTVLATRFDDATGRWLVSTDDGETVSARFVIAAVGCLSATNIPAFPGLAEFAGESHHTSRWPAEGVDFRGRRVGVVGTGSTGVQVIPRAAERAAHVTVFQRTAQFVLPRGDRRLDPEEERDFREHHAERRLVARYSRIGTTDPVRTSARAALDTPAAERDAVYEHLWRHDATAGGFRSAFTDIDRDPAANETLAEFIRGKIRAVVRDPATAELLAPRDHPFGSRRVCYAIDYYEAYNRDNVTLLDVKRNPIAAIVPEGVRLTDGVVVELDALVFATGFDAFTGPVLGLGIVGAGGASLAEHWEDGPKAYLGLAVAGFPNLFIVTGPGSPSVLSNMMMSIEQHVDLIVDALVRMRDDGLERPEASREAEERWVAHVAELGSRSVYRDGGSWYQGANIPGKPTVLVPYTGGVGTYRRHCEEVVRDDYRGFVFA